MEFVDESGGEGDEWVLISENGETELSEAEKNFLGFADVSKTESVDDLLCRTVLSDGNNNGNASVLGVDKIAAEIAQMKFPKSEEEPTAVNANDWLAPPVFSDSDAEEGPLCPKLPTNSGEGRAHTPQKISRLTRRRASPLARESTLRARKVTMQTERRKKKMGRRKERRWENDNLLKNQSFWKTFGDVMGDETKDGLFQGVDALGMQVSRSDAPFAKIMNDSDSLQFFLSCKSIPIPGEGARSRRTRDRPPKGKLLTGVPPIRVPKHKA